MIEVYANEYLRIFVLKLELTEEIEEVERAHDENEQFQSKLSLRADEEEDEDDGGSMDGDSTPRRRRSRRGDGGGVIAEEFAV